MLNELFWELNSGYFDIQERAVAKVYTLPDEQLLHLVELEREFLQQERERISQNDYKRWWATLSVFLIIIIGSLWMPSLWLGFLTFIYLSHRTQKNIPISSPLLPIFEKADHPRFIVPALALLTARGHDPTVQQRLTILLKRLLPQFRAEDAKLINPAQHKALLTHLSRSYQNPDLSVCLLKALEQMGNESAVWVVSKIAEKRNPTVRERPVVEAAQRCLEAIQSRVAQSKEAETLLRSSSALEATSSETLLRPASPTAGTGSEELLRAGMQTDERAME